MSTLVIGAGGWRPESRKELTREVEELPLEVVVANSPGVPSSAKKETRAMKNFRWK